MPDQIRSDLPDLTLTWSHSARVRTPPRPLICTQSSTGSEVRENLMVRSSSLYRQGPLTEGTKDLEISLLE